MHKYSIVNHKKQRIELINQDAKELEKKYNLLLKQDHSSEETASGVSLSSLNAKCSKVKVSASASAELEATGVAANAGNFNAVGAKATAELSINASVTERKLTL